MTARTSIAPSPCLRWAGWTTSSPLRASAGSVAASRWAKPARSPSRQRSRFRAPGSPPCRTCSTVWSDSGPTPSSAAAAAASRSTARASAGLIRPRTVRPAGPPPPSPPARPPGSSSAVRSCRAGPPRLHLAAQLAVAPRGAGGPAGSRRVRPRVTGAARMPAAAVLRLQRDEPVAHVAYRTDQRLVLGAELGPQPPHVHVHRPGAAEVVIAPHLLQQVGPGEDPAGMLCEEFQQLELLEREIQHPAAQPRAVGGLVDGEVAGADLVRRRWRQAGLPADGEPQPGLDLRRPGRVEDHVVGAPVGR